MQGGPHHPQRLSVVPLQSAGDETLVNYTIGPARRVCSANFVTVAILLSFAHNDKHSQEHAWSAKHRRNFTALHQAHTRLSPSQGKTGLSKTKVMCCAGNDQPSNTRKKQLETHTRQHPTKPPQTSQCPGDQPGTLTFIWKSPKRCTAGQAADIARGPLLHGVEGSDVSMHASTRGTLTTQDPKAHQTLVSNSSLHTTQKPGTVGTWQQQTAYTYIHTTKKTALRHNHCVKFTWSTLTHIPSGRHMLQHPLITTTWMECTSHGPPGL